MVIRYPGENAFLGSHKVGNYAQLRFSSCEGCSPSSSSPGGFTCFEETIRTFLRNLDDFGNDEIQERASHQLQKPLDQTDTQESHLRIIEVAYEPDTVRIYTQAPLTPSLFWQQAMVLTRNALPAFLG